MKIHGYIYLFLQKINFQIFIVSSYRFVNYFIILENDINIFMNNLCTEN